MRKPCVIAGRSGGVSGQRPVNTLCNGFVDDLTAAVETAFRANVVIHDGSTAVRAGGELRDDDFIVGPSLITALLGDLVFRMCHFFLLF